MAKKEKVVLLHRHGEAGTGGRASFLKFGEFKSRREAQKEARERDLDGARFVPKSRVKKTKHKLLFQIEPSKKRKSISRKKQSLYTGGSLFFGR